MESFSHWPPPKFKRQHPCMDRLCLHNSQWLEFSKEAFTIPMYKILLALVTELKTTPKHSIIELMRWNVFTNRENSMIVVCYLQKATESWSVRWVSVKGNLTHRWHVKLLLLLLLLLLWDRDLCSWGWLIAHCGPPASDSEVLELQACATLPSSDMYLTVIKILKRRKQSPIQKLSIAQRQIEGK